MHAKNFLFTYSRSIDTLQMTLDFAVHFCLRIKLSKFSSENGVYNVIKTFDENTREHLLLIMEYVIKQKCGNARVGYQAAVIDHNTKFLRKQHQSNYSSKARLKHAKFRENVESKCQQFHQ